MENILTTLGSTIPQALAAIVFLWDRFFNKKPRGQTHSPNFSLLMAVLLVLGFGATAGSLVYIHDHPQIKTVTVEKVVTVDKPIPCPTSQQKNGPATARGKIAIAHSGNNDTNTVAPPEASPSNSPH
jgi:hypothetical protein